MQGSILGTLEVLLGRRKSDYDKLSDDYKKDVQYAVASELNKIVNNKLRTLKTDLMCVMNVEIEVLLNIPRELYKIKMKSELANKIISDAKVSLDKELHEFISHIK